MHGTTPAVPWPPSAAGRWQELPFGPGLGPEAALRARVEHEVMPPIKPRRTVLGLGLALLWLGISHPRPGQAESPAPAAVEEPPADPGAIVDGGAGGEPVAEAPGEAVATGDVGAAEPASATDGPADGPLRGRQGAATALAVRDPATALTLLDGEPPAAEGTPAWCVHGALRGRALRLLDRPDDAVTELEPRFALAKLDDCFPRDVLGLELAQARLTWAEDERTSPVTAEEQRQRAIDELGTIRRIDTLRTLAAVRVLQARAMAGLRGKDGDARLAKRLAGKAAKALSQIVLDYPNHPHVGVLRLDQARALARAGKHAEAATELRRIAIERAGEPESDEAWAELQALAADDPKVKVPPLSFAEKLEQASFARGLRRVQASRAILDALLADPDLSASRRRQVHRSRSYTAYKQRDFQTCVDDLRPIYEATGNGQVRLDLLRCLERGELYDEALSLWQRRIDSKRKGTRAAGLWEGIELAVRAGRYAQADAWLRDYEALSSGHRSQRAWLRPWLAYRLGRDADAIEGLRTLADGRSRDATRARYFLGKLLVASEDPGAKAEGTTLLQQLAAGDAWGYYGLMARQRLLDAELSAPPVPTLAAVADEARTPSRARAERTLAELDASLGEAWPTLRRTRQLYEAGYVEEARRELRVTTSAYLDARHGHAGGPRSEALIAGLGWKAEWDYPRARTTSLGRKTLRDDEQAEALRVGLRALSHDLSEPYAWAKLGNGRDGGSSKARWHPRAFRASVEREARLRGIEPIHLWSLMYTESRFRRHVVSPVGARGALQVMPWTGYQLAERLGELPPDDRFDPDVLFDIDTNAHLAGYYVAELLHKFHGQAPMAYASYNGGPSNVGRWLRAKSKEGRPLELDAFIEEIVFDESQRYTRRVVEVSAAYAMLYEGRLPRWSNAVDPVVEDNIGF